MYALIVVTHGALGEMFLETAGMIAGQTENAAAVGFNPGEGVEDLEESIQSSLAEFQGCEGALCLVDLPGGSPARVAAQLAYERSDLEVLTGVNLSMVVEAVLSRADHTLKEAVRTVEQAGRESISDIGARIREA